MITSEDLAQIYELFTYGIGIGGLLSAIIWVVAYTFKKCLQFFNL